MPAKKQKMDTHGAPPSKVRVKKKLKGAKAKKARKKYQAALDTYYSEKKRDTDSTDPRKRASVNEFGMARTDLARARHEANDDPRDTVPTWQELKRSEEWEEGNFKRVVKGLKKASRKKKAAKKKKK